ncbi:TRAP transporter large permease subunit, partial [Ancylomarina sp. 16SWW S1-10-2]|uniref:TRAP transporter large permease subunit n=1 Tax=Ancylomarina sp. 16SWW S1-10-2 TaxID=2499681 RepID=UPI001E28E90B
MLKTLFKVFIGVALILSVLYALNMLKAISPMGFKGVSTSLAVLVIGFIAYKLRNKKAGIKRGLKILWQAVPSLFLLIIVIGGIIAGFFTATEASAVAVLYALVLSLIYKEITVKDIPKIVLGSVKTTAIVLILVATCIGLSWI